MTISRINIHLLYYSFSYLLHFLQYIMSVAVAGRLL